MGDLSNAVCTQCTPPWQTTPLPAPSRSVGGLPRLAEYLGVAEALLQEWLEGKRDPPTLMREGARQEEMTSRARPG
jgi:hypothetical protein